MFNMITKYYILTNTLFTELSDTNFQVKRQWSLFVSVRCPTLSPFIYSHLTRTSTWTDPRSLAPKLLDEFDWRSLPPGWEMFLDELGEIYYVQ